MPYVYSDDELDLRADYMLYGGEGLYETFEASDDREEEVEYCAGLLEVAAVEYETGEELHDALSAHKAVCANCLCERKDVVSDRLYVRADAVCCGEVA